MKISNKIGITVISITTLIFYINYTAVASHIIIPATDTLKTILFVGNSLTYTNDLPGRVVRLAKEKGVELRTEMIAHPDYALEDHWNDGQLQKLLAEKHFDFVVIQQGPSSQEDGRMKLMDYGARIATLCKKYGARVVFFMVWPSFSNLSTFDNVIKNYSDAAAVTNSLLCPVGQEWKKHFLENGNYSYYSSDKFHPSEKGSESVARIILETIIK